MSEYRHATAPNLVIAADYVQYAYRRFGRIGGPPLLLLNYFAANLDAWDPEITDGFASVREVILLDGAGVGRSSGVAPCGPKVEMGPLSPPAYPHRWSILRQGCLPRPEA